MAERRVPDVVRQGSRRDDRPEIVEPVPVCLGEVRVVLQDGGTGQAPEAAADHRYLQTMRQPGVHKVRFGKRDHLGLVLEAPEIGREDHAVVIHLEPEAGLVLFRPQAFMRISLSLKR